MENIEMRVRVTYSKQIPLRFTSILDLQKIWERSCRRAGIPLLYSQGFHPQARIQQASPLPLGFCGEREIIDFWVEPSPAKLFQESSINPFLPQGLQILQTEFIDPFSKSLQPFVDASDYSISFFDPLSEKDLAVLLEKIQTSETILFTKHNGKQYDLKPLIRSIHAKNDPSGKPFLNITLSSSPNATGRPDHVLQYFHYAPSHCLITRTMIHFLNYV